MIDIVIPYVHSRWGGRELIYALRSAEKHLTGIGQVYVIGDKPAGLSVNHIPHPSDMRAPWKEKNIKDRLMLACESMDISDPFLYMNDDHFLLQDYDAALFPNYYTGWGIRTGTYSVTVANTRPHAEVFFDVHCPMLIDKMRFIQRMNTVDWDVKYGYCMKSIYAVGLDGVERSDLKIYQQETPQRLRQLIAGRPWFSIADGVRGHEMEAVLKELYPKKSKYECAP